MSEFVVRCVEVVPTFVLVEAASEDEAFALVSEGKGFVLSHGKAESREVVCMDSGDLLDDDLATEYGDDDLWYEEFEEDEEFFGEEGEGYV